MSRRTVVDYVMAAGPHVITGGIVLYVGLDYESAPARIAGAGLLVAGLVGAGDVVRRHHEAAAAKRAAERRGLDETRRLLYALLMPLSAGRQPSPTFIGTLANSLVHQLKIEESDEEVINTLWSAHMSPGAPSEDGQQRIAWVRSHIARLTARIEEIDGADR